MVFVVSKDNKLEPRPVELDGWAQANGKTSSLGTSLADIEMTEQ